MNYRFLDNAKFLNRISYFNGFTGKYDMPVIKKQDIELKSETVSFNNRKPGSVALHFFIDDYQFDRIWNNPERYIEMFKNYEYICSPDYSLFTDFPKVLQIYNTYKKQFLGALFQSYGINVVPTVSWSDSSSWEWCFDGIEKGSCVACSSVGCLKDPEAKRLFTDGFVVMVHVLEPSKILMVGKLPKELERFKELCVFVKSFQEEIRTRGYETLIAFNEKGEPVKAYKGNKNSVAFPQTEAYKWKNYVVTHNHPDVYGGTFSFADMKNMCKYEFSEHRAVAFEGTYIIKKTKKSNYNKLKLQVAQNMHILKAKMKDVANKIRKEYENTSEDKRISQKALNKKIRQTYCGVLHRFYKKVCEKCGFIYVLKPNYK